VRVLVVEDEPRLAAQVASALEEAGYAVDRAGDGARADFLARTEHYDAVILDLGLPTVDGLTLLQRWRADALAMPVLVLTARALRAFADGFVAVLLPAYLLALGHGQLEVGLLSTATLFGSATATLAVGRWGHRFALRRLLLAAAVLMAAGASGKRYSLPNSRFLIHQPLGYGLQGQATDIEIHTKEILDARDRLNKILSHHTGQPIDKIKVDTDRDNFMSGEQAKAYGLVDQVLDRRGQLPMVNPEK